VTIDPGGPLTDAELRDLVQLLARYAEHELDQFDDWQIPTTYGPVYMFLSRALPPGWPADAFAPIWPPRFADAETRPGEDASSG
jgi:hypothetical protein